VLTGGVYNGCSEDVLEVAKLIVEQVVELMMLVELDTVDSLFFLPESI
jgi:hypothetical protein